MHLLVEHHTGIIMLKLHLHLVKLAISLLFNTASNMKSSLIGTSDVYTRLRRQFRVSKRALEVSPIGGHTGAQPSMPQADCLVDNVLLQTVQQSGAGLMSATSSIDSVQWMHSCITPKLCSPPRCSGL